MSSNKGARRLADMNHATWVNMVFLAYQRTLEETVLKGMDEDELRLLWERRPKDEDEGDLMEEILFEFDPEEAEREKFEMTRGADGRLNTHRRGTADSKWGT